MLHSMIYAFIIAFAVTAALLPVLIPVLHRLKFGQPIRHEGPASHEKKSGTPTMGGVSFLLALCIVMVIFAGKYPEMWPVFLATIGFGLIGFADDFIKIGLKNNEGLKPWQKMAAQILVTTLLCIYVMTQTEDATKIIIPFTGGAQIDLGLLYIPVFYLAVLGTDNGVNLTDGLDGLSSSVTIPVALFFAAAAYAKGSGIAMIGMAIAGGLLGYLMYNAYPAKVFMGDTGSLALGGFVASAAVMLKMPLFILIAGLIYVVETVSVMLQVAYFKKTHGKRLFRMTPIHHHFELGGWSETRVDTVFGAVTIVCCFIAFLAM